MFQTPSVMGDKGNSHTATGIKDNIDVRNKHCQKQNLYVNHFIVRKTEICSIICTLFSVRCGYD